MRTIARGKRTVRVHGLEVACHPCRKACVDAAIRDAFGRRADVRRRVAQASFADDARMRIPALLAGGGTVAVKALFRDPGTGAKAGRIWVSVRLVDLANRRVGGILANRTDDTKSLRLGQWVEVPFADVCDVVMDARSQGRWTWRDVRGETVSLGW